MREKPTMLANAAAAHQVSGLAARPADDGVQLEWDAWLLFTSGELVDIGPLFPAC